VAGNTDGHIKNISLVYDRKLKSVRLAPAYDIVSTIVYDSHSTEMAFSVGGEIEWNKIDRRCFEEACKESGLYKKLFMERFDRMREMFRPSLMMAAEVMKDEGYNAAVDLAGKILQRTTA
jgi:serine/threonine-protein kinase HipA